MNKLLSSFVVGSAVAMVGLSLSAQVEQIPMDDPSWGYELSGIGSKGLDTAYVFTNTTATMSWTAPDGVQSIELLVVGGGGAGGSGALEKAKGGWAMGGGGGGAGGFLHVDSKTVNPGSTYEIIVGAGAVSIDDQRGRASAFDDTIAQGGGCGGYISEGFGGGCGGGGSCGPFNSSSTTKELSYDGGVAESGQGFSGGSGKNETKNSQVRYGSGGGGGGAGSSGGNVPNNDCGGNGGAGLTCAITGEQVVYSAGGGGASDGAGNAAGEAGGIGAGRGGQGGAGANATGYGCGGGGGAALKDVGVFSGGKGFQGVVIVRVNPLPNSWTTEPSVSATEWIVGQAPDDLAINLGAAQHGTVVCNRTAEGLKDLDIGDYEVVFSAAEEGFETAQKTVVVKVIAEAVEIMLTNEGGSPISAEDLSAGSTVVVNFTDNDNQDLVLSVAYGRYDKGEDFTHDPDTLEKAAEDKRDYDPEHFGGWDYFDPIALIEAGQKSYAYTIPVNFGKIYAKDWTGKTIPEKYMLPTDKIRFFLTPKNQTPMKSLTSVIATDPTRQFLTSVHLVDMKQMMPSMNDVKVASGMKNTKVFEFFPDDMTDPTLVLNMYIGSDGKPYYNYRDSTKTSGTGYNKVIGTKTISTSAAYKWQVNCANGRGYANDTYVTETASDLPTTTRDSGYMKFYGVGTMGKITIYKSDWKFCQHYLMPSLGYNANGDLVAGYYCSIVHKFFSSEGGVEFVAGPDDAQYHKDLLLDVPVRGMSELMSCHVHEWDYENVEVLVPATCTQKGNGQVACKVDGCPFPDARLAVEIDALGHVWGDWVVEKQPTCTEAGYKVRICTREACDHVGSPETNQLSMIAHQRIFVKEEGGKLHYSCANCETEIVEDPAYGQIWDWLQTDGTGYIVTDYKPSFLATKIISDVAKWSKATDSSLYSDDITGMSGKFQLRIWRSGTISFYNWPYGDNHGQPWSEAKFDNTQTGIPFQHIAYQDRATFRGVTSESGANEYWADFTDATRRAEKPLVFFADLNSEEKDASKKVRYVATAKVRGFKVYEVDGNDETLVHDYVPATKSGANAGLWDRVENKYWPATSAGFTTGKNQGLSITIR